MTPKHDATVGPEKGPDELEGKRIVGKPGEPSPEPVMVPPEDRETDPDRKPLTHDTAKALLENLLTPIHRTLDKHRTILENLQTVFVGPVDQNGKIILGEDGFPKHGIGRQNHTTNGHLAVIRGNTDARALADRLFELFQTELRREIGRLEEADSSLLDRIVKLEDTPHGTNGGSGAG